jgi:hypothetical protein
MNAQARLQRTRHPRNLLGQYLAAVRPLKARDRAKVKAIRAEKGFAAAMAEGRRLAK